MTTQTKFSVLFAEWQQILKKSTGAASPNLLEVVEFPVMLATEMYKKEPEVVQELLSKGPILVQEFQEILEEHVIPKVLLSGYVLFLWYSALFVAKYRSESTFGTKIRFKENLDWYQVLLLLRLSGKHELILLMNRLNAHKPQLVECIWNSVYECLKDPNYLVDQNIPLSHDLVVTNHMDACRMRLNPENKCFDEVEFRKVFLKHRDKMANSWNWYIKLEQFKDIPKDSSPIDAGVAVAKVIHQGEKWDHKETNKTPFNLYRCQIQYILEEAEAVMSHVEKLYSGVDNYSFKDSFKKILEAFVITSPLYVVYQTEIVDPRSTDLDLDDWGNIVFQLICLKATKYVRVVQKYMTTGLFPVNKDLEKIRASVLAFYDKSQDESVKTQLADVFNIVD